MTARMWVLVLSIGCSKKPADEPPPQGKAGTSGHSVTKLKTADDASDGGGSASAAPPAAPSAGTGKVVDGVTAISVGPERACAIIEEGTKLPCWAKGQGATAVDAPTAILSVAGAACAILDDKTVWCWPHRVNPASGTDKGAGQVGVSTTDVCAGHGLFVWCWKPSDDAPRSSFDWPGVDKLIVGNGKVCTTAMGGTVECMPVTNKDGRAEVIAGLKDVNELAGGGDLWCATHNNGTVECWTDPQQRLAIAGVTGATAVAVSPGGDACALNGSGSLTCWRIKAMAVESGSTKTLTLSGVTSFGVGNGFGCAVDSDHVAKCWDQSYAVQPVHYAK